MYFSIYLVSYSVALMSLQCSSEVLPLAIAPHCEICANWEKNSMEEDKCYICVLFGLMLFLFSNKQATQALEIPLYNIVREAASCREALRQKEWGKRAWWQKEASDFILDTGSTLLVVLESMRCVGTGAVVGRLTYTSQSACP